jgi:hypothetical protein
MSPCKVKSWLMAKTSRNSTFTPLENKLDWLVNSLHFLWGLSVITFDITQSVRKIKYKMQLEYLMRKSLFMNGKKVFYMLYRFTKGSWLEGSSNFRRSKATHSTKQMLSSQASSLFI